jgi:DNA-binding CsgD family transcriptional regulator/tetratricopeptide (TPR) repeat protein
VTVTAPQLVGRDRECARLTEFAAASGARALLVRGEPGIGKTALWRLGLQECERAGARVLVTRPGEEEMQLGLTGLVDLFGADPAVLADNPFERGHAVLAALRVLAAGGPVVIAIDDLQWLDSGSARALRFALRRLDAEPVAVLATLRPGEDPLALTATLPPGRTEEIVLGPLTRPELRRLLSHAVDAITPPALQRIYELSAGNPLYALELARARQARRSLPDSLQAAIAARLDGSGELAGLLCIVSALGPTTVRVVREALPDAPVEAQLDAAQERGLLVVDDDLGVRFEHPLIGSVVYERMPAFARRELHARLAAAASDPDVRARHLALSTDEPDTGVAQLLEAAAIRARDREAFDRAAEFAGHGLRLTPDSDRDGRLRRALMEIDNLTMAGDLNRALELADRLVASSRPGPERCEALLERAYIDDDDVVAVVDALRAALPEAGEDGVLRSRMLAHTGWALALFAGDLPRALESLHEWERSAGSVGDPQHWMSCAAETAYIETLGGRPREDLMAEAVACEARVSKPMQWTSPRTLQAETRLWAGDLAEARALFEAVHDDATRTGVPLHHPYSMFDLALVEIAAGELGRAEERVLQGIEAAHDAEDTWAERLLLYPRALVDAWRGRAGPARAAARLRIAEAEAKRERPGVVRGLTVLGLLALSEGDHVTASRELAEAAAMLDTIGYRHPGAFPVLPDAVEALACNGEQEAEQLLARLGREAEALECPWPHAAYERARGALLLAGGRPDHAVEPLAGAAEAFDALGYRPDAARAVLLHGRALLRAGRRGQAAETLAEARRRFAVIGAPLWEARAADELERAAPGRTRGELTPAERRIAALVAEGKRNREIGQTLFMSVATVEAHLTRTYRKLGIRSRSELTRRMAESNRGVGETR